jgi:hypothetical protein
MVSDPQPAPLFQIVDPRLSKYWSVRVSEGDGGSNVLSFFLDLTDFKGVRAG